MDRETELLAELEEERERRQAETIRADRERTLRLGAERCLTDAQAQIVELLEHERVMGVQALQLFDQNQELFTRVQKYEREIAEVLRELGATQSSQQTLLEALLADGPSPPEPLPKLTEYMARFIATLTPKEQEVLAARFDIKKEP